MDVKAISMVGTGKLGLSMAACFADKGYDVWGVDIDEEVVKSINKGISPVTETGLAKLLSRCKENVFATIDYREAVLNTQITFIVVATPSKADGTFSNKQIREALTQIGLALKEKKAYHLVVITSTVMPGTTESIALPILEKTSGKKCGVGIGLAYNPEFIALGSVIHDFLNPDFILIGEMSRTDGDILTNIYGHVCDNTPRFARMNPVNAEITKISLNCYVTMKISYANSLAAICENVPGADAEIITNAVGLDARVGSKYIKPALGFGGPCFPRDNIAFAAFARLVNGRAKLAETVHEVNQDQIKRINKIVEGLVVDSGKPEKETIIGILGLSYKPETPVIEDSQAIDIANDLSNAGYRVMVYDPQAMDSAVEVLGNKVVYAATSKKCVEEADILLIATPWKEFKSIDFSGSKPNLLILDCWGILRDNVARLKIKKLGRWENTFESG